MIRLKLWLGAILAALGAGFVIALQLASGQRAKVRAKQAESTIERIQDGQDAMREGRASGLSPDERLRRNDGQW